MQVCHTPGLLSLIQRHLAIEGKYVCSWGTWGEGQKVGTLLRHWNWTIDVLLDYFLILSCIQICVMHLSKLLFHAECNDLIA